MPLFQCGCGWMRHSGGDSVERVEGWCSRTGTITRRAYEAEIKVSTVQLTRGTCAADDNPLLIA